jgi:hypothetical protein
VSAFVALTACGGGGSATAADPVEVHIVFSADRQWNMPTDGTAILVPGRVKSVRVGAALEKWGWQWNGNRIELTCTWVPVDAHSPDIPAPAEMWATLEPIQ